ncbi:glycosyltransferase [Aquisalimonas sp.]|uniref:glycosyltransferase n=1 Tax=Aquisalimonas sp. TaxID=1872621 RepID=UPI0025C67F69|nr:glycosyltransferase [Aquisalimonas sp.]
MPERVALLFATSGHSGVDRVIHNLLPEFAHSGAAFDLLVIGGHGPSIPEALPCSIRIVRLPVRTKKLVFPALIPYLLRHRPTALLTANHQLNRAALLARRLTGIPARVAIRMGMSLTAMGAEMRPAQRERLFRSMRHWYPTADAVIAPSQGVGEDLVQIATVRRERLHVIRNPLVNAQLHRMAADTPDHPWFAAGQPPIILGAGSLEPRKDFATLIRAFACVREEIDCKLVILGEGGERGRLSSLAVELGVADALDMPGFAANPYQYMRRAAVFALSSRREGASAVIVEALACGTPVVSTDCPSGPAEVLQPMGARALAAVGDHEALARQLLNMLKDPLSPQTLSGLITEHEASASARAYLNAIIGP